METKSPSQVPVGVDPNRPSVARVYGGFLGGKDMYEVDRQVMATINAAVPEAVDIARGNRGFLSRACRFLSRQTEIDQFLDCGSGLPTAENTHQIVQRFNDEARVVYVDNDPVVLAHGRALLVENDYVRMVGADIYEPDQVFEDEVVRTHLDFARPMVLLHVGTVHHYEGDGAALMREYIDRIASGSYVVFSHFYDPEVPELTRVAKKIEDILVNGPFGAGRFRTHPEIMAMLDGLELVAPNGSTEPGRLVPCDEWWPDGPSLTPLSDAGQCIVAAVGRKP
ncbi:SAM-dependent methyltransferase [Actinophytocola gossypii]|uniref:SAM-dependent methyltransferase n=1 Tax=Actinophytocola gossypii TaxID=2812003 RepID=A0ABT2J9D9_9PSEU|nr:SAM-dependent methyltransferase [Actinophytocola gossypii]MCT2584401.1 SAM-dependent methyltransferase [Actinophytocola gossypii]